MRHFFVFVSCLIFLFTGSVSCYAINPDIPRAARQFTKKNTRSVLTQL